MAGRKADDATSDRRFAPGEALEGADTPRDRLFAIVHASFGGSNFERETAAAWLNFYALALVAQLGVSEGVLRIGCMHYNTLAEIDRLFALLDDMPA